jgi:chromosome segregation ATPase
MRIAELEGELQSAKWRVDELTARNRTLEDELDAGLQTADELRTEIVSLTQAAKRRASTPPQPSFGTERTLCRAVESINALFETNQGLDKRLAVQSEEIDELRRVTKTQVVALEASKRRERLIDEEIESQRARANRLKSDLEKMTEKSSELDRELKTAQAQRERMQNETTRVLSEIDEAKRSRREAVAKMEKARSEASQLRAKLDGAEVEMQGALGQIEDLKSAITNGESAATRQLADALSALDAERTAARRFQEKQLLTEDKLADELSRAEGLNLAVTVLKAELENESKLMRLAGEDAARATGEVGGLRAKVEMYDERIKEQALEIDTNIRVLANLREMVDTLSKKLGDREAVDYRSKTTERMHLETLTQKTETLAKAIEEKQAELTVFANENNTLNTRLEDADAELESLRDQMSDMRAKVVTINQSRVDMSAELADAIERSERLDAKVKSDRETAENLTAEIAKLKNRLADTMVAASNAAAESHENSKKLAEAFREAENAIKEKEVLVASLTDQLEDRERRSTKLERENRLLNEQVREHEMDVNSWHMELKLRNARISQLEKEIELLRR